MGGKDRMTADLNAGKSSGCGRICFSLESEPTILDISPEMKKMLGMVEGEEKWLRIFKETPALLLGEAEEKKLKDCLCAVRTAGEPALFEGTFLTVDHQPLPVWGMIDRAGDRDAACFTGTFYDRAGQPPGPGGRPAGRLPADSPKQLRLDRGAGPAGRHCAVPVLPQGRRQRRHPREPEGRPDLPHQAAGGRRGSGAGARLFCAASADGRRGVRKPVF